MPKGITISAKMMFAFAALLALVAAIGGFAIMKIGEVNQLSAQMRSNTLPATQLIGDIHAYTSQYRIQQSGIVTAPTPESKAKAEKMIRNASNAISGMMDDYEKLLNTKEQKDLFATLKTNWAQYQQQTDQLISLAQSGDSAAASAMFEGESLDMFYTVEDSILQLIDLNQKSGQAISAKSESIYADSRRMLMGAVGLGLVVTLLLSGILMQTIAKPVRKMAGSVGLLVEGDLTVEIPGMNRKDELGSLARALDSFKALFEADKQRAEAEAMRARETEETINAIGAGLSALAKGQLTHRVDENANGPLAKLYNDYNDALSHLQDAMVQIVEGCNTIKNGTNEIAQASSDLSLRTERQAESLAHTSKTLGEFTGSVKVAADNARQTSSRLAVARESAEKVDETAKRAVVAMRNIQASSKEMNEIISTIDGLAFQTNLLALNAGVEAARAGASGAGFAVVATEVRHLAQRSAEAANSIRQLVATSNAQITDGVSLVENSGEALRQIVTEVTEVSDLMDEIAQAASRQASGLAEISDMVTAMDTATQQNAAMVEESTASSRNLNDETERLFEQLSFFELGRAGGYTGGLGVAPSHEEERAPSYRPPAPASRGNLALAVDEDDWAEF
ncbi:MAG: methyl-accepting chemotaxis protein [Sphingobium sp.]|nr:methyl-accepting chemotaxis protein [Sphingobium sp.]MCI1270497.1 methyl-accepting chemotaxis protein [Sphingobium sp.]MCI1756482.1 methyl-accepting chemotaxis protein [Sphingobium sp.]MCI2051819.1 methyl-accepting chemotaxis protein [Sphingobium sp.]